MKYTVTYQDKSGRNRRYVIDAVDKQDAKEACRLDNPGARKLKVK